MSSNRHATAMHVALVLLLFFAAAAHMLLRGPVNHRGHIAMFDFAMFHAASRAWLVGEQPYDRANLWPTWVAAGAPEQELMAEYWTSVLPPGAFALASPIAALPAPAALGAWNALSLACVGLMLWSVLSLAGVRGIDVWIFCAAALASAPVQTLLMVGQTSLPTIALLFFAVERARNGRLILAGLLVGLAACFKPQLALPVAVYFLLVGMRWRATVAAIIVTLAINTAASLWIVYHGHMDWFTHWMANIAATSATGMNDDPSLAGPWRHQMIHLQVLLHAVSDHRLLVQAVSWVLSGLLALGFIVLLFLLVRHRFAGAVTAQPDRRSELLLFATFSALILLPVYHKSYDAAMLLPALAWALLELRGANRAVARVMLVAMLPLLVPFDLVELLAARLAALQPLAQTWLWQALISPHHAWAVLAVSLCLLAALGRHALGPATSVHEAPQPAADAAAAADFAAPEGVPVAK